MLDRAVAEVAACAEELAVVGGDGDVGVGRHEVEEALENAVEVADRLDLAAAQGLDTLDMAGVTTLYEQWAGVKVRAKT